MLTPNAALFYRGSASGGYCWQCGKALARGVNATFTDPIGNVHRVHKVCLKTLNEQRTVTAQPMHEAIGFGTYSSRKETT